MPSRASLLAFLVLFGLAVPHALDAQPETPNGEALFIGHCSGCHNGAPEARAPAPEVLRQRSPTAILEVLANGSMRAQGASISGPERRAIAEYLGGAAIGGDPTGASTGRCGGPSRPQ